MYTPVSTRSASAYKRVAVDTGVQSADPHQLVGMLYDGLLQSLHQARGALARQDVAAKGTALHTLHHPPTSPHNRLRQILEALLQPQKQAQRGLP